MYIKFCFGLHKSISFLSFSEAQVVAFEVDAKFIDIRPRSYYTYKISELTKGMLVLANYNIEEPKSRGPW